MNTVHYDVVIIGAGIAGLGCAAKLIESRVSADRILILEARDRPGGRIYNASDNLELATNLAGISPAALEMGAGWIHGHGQHHLLSQLLVAEGADPAVLTDWRKSDFRYQSSGCSLGVLALAGAGLRVGLSAVIGRLRNALVSNRLNGVPASKLFSCPRLHQTSESKMLLYGLAEVSYAAPLSDMDLSLVGKNETRGVDAQPREGMSWFIRRLLIGAPMIRYGARVVRVMRAGSDEPVCAHLRCEDGTVVSARQGVVVTVPLGVLKNGMIQFSPPLPAAQQQALNRVAMTRFTKVLVVFPRRFWSAEKHAFIVVRDDRAARDELQAESNLCLWHNVSAIHGAVPDQPSALLGIATSHGARFVDSLTQDELEQLVSQRLCAAFGLDKLPCKPLAILRSEWNKDPLSGYGAYSYPTLGASDNDFATLAEDCPPFYFAGEHTWFKEIGTVHGALQSGQAAAQRILNMLSEPVRDDLRRKSSIVTP